MDYRNMPPLTEAKRGIIIADNSTIKSMSTSLDKEFLSKKDKNTALTDALLLFANQGYFVIIPEMVAYENSHMMRDGKSTDRYFSTVPDYRRKEYYIMGSKFLKDVYNSEGTICIMPPPENDSSPASELINKCWQISNEEYPKKINGFKNRTTKEGFESSRRLELSKIQNIASKNYGAMAAYDLVRHMPKLDVPVFYLSVDNDAIVNIAGANADIPINQFNVCGLCQALRVNELFKYLNIIPQADYKLLSEYSTLKASEGNDYSITTFMTRPDDRLRLPDGELAPREDGDLKGYPFSYSLRGLNKEIKREERPQVVKVQTETESEKPKDSYALFLEKEAQKRMEKFGAKFR